MKEYTQYTIQNILYLPKNPHKYYIILLATKSTLTIKNIAHLIIGLKFNISFMRNNSFYKNF